MEEITDPDEKMKMGIPFDWKVSIERPQRKGLSFTVYESDDVLFNEELQRHIKNMDLRFVATAIRYDREKIDGVTWELLASVLEKSYKRPRKRPENLSLSSHDRRNSQIKAEYDELLQQGVSQEEINRIQMEKYGPGSGYSPMVGTVDTLRKARTSVPKIYQKLINSLK